MNKILAGCGLALATLAATSIPAYAVAPDCADQHACIYINLGYDGKIGDKVAGSPRSDARYVKIMSSWTNKTYATGAWFDNSTSKPAACYSMAPRTNNYYVGDPANDKLMSWQMTTGC